MGAPARKSVQHQDAAYPRIRAINGEHPFKDRVPCGYVEYQARRRKNGKIVYFNFALAKEMGLLAKEHPEVLTPALTEALLETFALIIINEYDIAKGTKFPPEDVKENRYMATRYLQLQHPGRKGVTSGDGRSIWNGYTVDRKGRMWDITSCGTGATCLSPATAIQGKFFKSGDPNVSYGCGYSSLSEGIIDLILSEIFTANNISTERVLGVIEFPGGFAIKIRAGMNLLRPSHFFNHLKQNQYQRLKNAVDIFIERQLRNKAWAPIPKGMNPYKYLLQQEAHTFAKISAQFEAEYIFCWLDWDGDNILADGGIIDFGSIRQFGLYHHEYRFDDVERWSTNIKEQKYKARYIVQTFAQMVDYLITGKKKPHRVFRKAPVLKEFDRVFTETKRKYLLQKIGFTAAQADTLVKDAGNLIRKFESLYYNFEATKSSRGPIKVPDGITWNAVFCMRDVLRMLPKHFATNQERMAEEEFMNIMKSKYADKESTKLTPYMRYKIRSFQRHYSNLIAFAAKKQGATIAKMFQQIADRSAVINRYERITGDAVCMIGDDMTKQRKNFRPEQFHQLLHSFIYHQILNPDLLRRGNHQYVTKHPKAKSIIDAMNRVVKDYREGI